MSEKAKIIILSVAALLVGYFGNQLLCNDPVKVEKIIPEVSSDTTETETITEAENYFSAEEVGNIKRLLIDSLDAFYQDKINQLKDESEEADSQPDRQTGSYQDYVYSSVIDTTFIAADSSGITDSIYVQSVFISPVPLSQVSLHSLNIKHQSFTREKIITITNTVTVEKEKSFFEKFKIAPNVSAGYGMINKKFDIYTGIGIQYEL